MFYIYLKNRFKTLKHVLNLKYFNTEGSSLELVYMPLSLCMTFQYSRNSCNCKGKLEFSYIYFITLPFLINSSSMAQSVCLSILSSTAICEADASLFVLRYFIICESDILSLRFAKLCFRENIRLQLVIL